MNATERQSFIAFLRTTADLLETANDGERTTGLYMNKSQYELLQKLFNITRNYDSGEKIDTPAKHYTTENEPCPHCGSREGIWCSSEHWEEGEGIYHPGGDYCLACGRNIGTSPADYAVAPDTEGAEKHGR